MRKNSNKMALFKQTLEDLQNIHRDTAGFDMKYDEFKDLSRKTWKVEDYIHLQFDRFEKSVGNHCICNGNKPNKCKELIPETNRF